ncbi:phage portal protein [bacterium endosymbiont of Escarpia laminata]|nr:MAG: phage portal protein [bacterium endosymbiont of Escarpia laminata]
MTWGVMVPRARDLVRNNGLAAGYIQTAKDNIVGHVLKLSAKPITRLLGWDSDQGVDWAKQVESEFTTWSETTECDATREMTLLGLTAQALGAAMYNGEALCIPKWSNRPGSRWNTRLMLIEADRMDTPPHLKHRPDIQGGKEKNANGETIAYWVRKRHPGDATLWTGNQTGINEWERIPAFTTAGRRQAIHLYDAERSGQSRGRTVLSAVMKEFKQIGRYTQEELKGTIVNALTAGFIESSLDQASLMELFSSQGATDPQSMSQNWMNQFRENRVQLRGGAMIPLPLGAKVTPFIPGRPNQAFEQFMLAVQRNIAAGLNIPYELLAKDFSKTNYSSARAALLEAWRYFLGRRRWLVDHWLRPIYELWFEEAIDKGRIVAPDFYQNKYAYLRCKFIFAGRGWVDPLKEIKAAQGRMESEITNLEIEGAEQGYDWEEVLEGKARVLRKRQELGLPISQEEGGGALAVADEVDEEDPDKADRQESASVSAEIEIEELDLSMGTYKALSSAGVSTVGDLLSMTGSQLLAVDGIGRKRLEEINNIAFPTEATA